MSGALYSAAMSYVEQSPQWPIIPISPTTKRPAIKTGRDHLAGASTDRAVIERWIGGGFSIGMPTGAASGAVVLDVDKKYDGESLLAALEDALGPLPRSRVARTRSGGLHIYCAHPGNGIRVRSGAGPHSPLGRLLCGRPGIDVRACGGLVVLPPTPGYKWITDEDLMPLPALWFAAIQGAGEPKPAPRPVVDRPVDGVVARMLSTLQPIAEGGRNNMLFKLGVKLRHIGLSDAEVLSGLEQINSRCVVPALSQRELEIIWRSATRGAA